MVIEKYLTPSAFKRIFLFTYFVYPSADAKCKSVIPRYFCVMNSGILNALIMSSSFFHVRCVIRSTRLTRTSSITSLLRLHDLKSES